MLPARRDDTTQLQDALEKSDPHAVLLALRSQIPGAHEKVHGKTPLDDFVGKVSQSHDRVKLGLQQAVVRVLSAGDSQKVSKAAVPWLSAAVCAGQFSVIEHLVKLGADVDQQDHQRDYSTPLMLAVSCGLFVGVKVTLCELLLMLGADLTVQRKSDSFTIDDVLKQNARNSRSWRRLQEVSICCEQSTLDVLSFQFALLAKKAQRRKECNLFSADVGKDWASPSGILNRELTGI